MTASVTACVILYLCFEGLIYPTSLRSVLFTIGPICLVSLGVLANALKVRSLARWRTRFGEDEFQHTKKELGDLLFDYRLPLSKWAFHVGVSAIGGLIYTVMASLVTALISWSLSPLKSSLFNQLAIPTPLLLVALFIPHLFLVSKTVLRIRRNQSLKKRD
jgi:hypothetical protein